MRRSFLLLTTIFLLSITSFAQTFRSGVPNLVAYDMERFHFGFSLGIDIVDLNLKTKSDYTSIMSGSENQLLEIYSKATPAFNVGIVTNMRIGRYFDLRFIPSFSIAHDIDLYYRFANDVAINSQGKVIFTPLVTKKIECHYVNFPLLIKFKSSRMHNVRFYVLAGGQVSVNMMSTKNNKIQVSYLDDAQAEITPIIKSYDIQTKGGLGFDFYTTYFKFTTELKVAFGVINMLENERGIKDKNNIWYYRTSPIVTGLESLKSKTFTISFIIE